MILERTGSTGIDPPIGTISKLLISQELSDIIHHFQNRTQSNQIEQPRGYKMKIVVAPDSFKGSISSPAITEAIAQGIRRAFPEAEIDQVPLADGGEGTLQTAHSLLGGRIDNYRVRGITGTGDVSVPALWLSDGEVLLESAYVVGIDQTEGSHIFDRTSFGLGQLIGRVLEDGAKSVYCALGGTGSNDGGAGMVVGLGARVLDGAGIELPPTLRSLIAAGSFEFDRLIVPDRLRLVALSDVDNPLTGPKGATAVFGPQKGLLDAEELALADSAVERWADAAETALDRHVRGLPGAGAAGGIGFACLLLGGEFCSGANWLLDRADFDARVRGADWILTGEGRSDDQTLSGKLPARVAERAGAVPVTLLSGSVDRAARRSLGALFKGGCFSIADGPTSLDDLRETATARLADSAESLARLRFADSV